MQLNVPDHQYASQTAREHRVRLWWTAYILDRTCTSKIGLPVSVDDGDIQVNLPSIGGAGSLESDDFGDVDYELCSISLSKITARLTEQIYGRRHYQTAFSQRVQTTLKALNKWMEELPPQLHLHIDSSLSPPPMHILYLHLRFNQVAVTISTQV